MTKESTLGYSNKPGITQYKSSKNYMYLLKNARFANKCIRTTHHSSIEI